MMSLTGLLILFVLACGATSPGEDDAPTAVSPTAISPATEAPTATQPPAAREDPTEAADALKRIAAELAGKPGAIYVGDISQLAGPAPAEELGGLDEDGNADGSVPLESLERHLYLYEHPFYQDLLEKANYTNPTKLVSSGEKHVIQHACVNRALLPCILIEHFLAPSLYERTNGQVEILITSFPELGIAGPDVLTLVADGTLTMAQVYSGYIAGELPAIEIVTLWGVYPDNEITYRSQVTLLEDLEQLVLDETGGVVINHNWFSGVEQYFFCKERIDTLEDFKGKKTRSHSAALSDWINGMGAAAQFVAFAEVYTALERGILDCGVTVAFAAHAQRWYEVTDYMVGPLSSQLLNTVIVNRDVWDGLPSDIQQILLEEGARHELEAMRVTPAWNEVWIQRNIDAGLEYQEFSDALMDHMRNVVATEHVVPGFISRQDEDNRDNIIALFNEKIAPIVGLKVLPDGTTERVPITQ
jgi:TRAP-type C4-dicarboxylate transport system substrate-binding protein